MQEVDELEVFTDGKVGEEGLYHLLVGSEVPLVYLHHQNTENQLQLYLELLLCDVALLHLGKVATNDEVVHLRTLNQIDLIADELEDRLEFFGYYESAKHLGQD